jgi:hypothetical protein
VLFGELVCVPGFRTFVIKRGGSGDVVGAVGVMCVCVSWTLECPAVHVFVSISNLARHFPNNHHEKIRPFILKMSNKEKRDENQMGVKAANQKHRKKKKKKKKKTTRFSDHARTPASDRRRQENAPFAFNGGNFESTDPSESGVLASDMTLYDSIANSGPVGFTRVVPRARSCFVCARRVCSCECILCGKCLWCVFTFRGSCAKHVCCVCIGGTSLGVCAQCMRVRVACVCSCSCVCVYVCAHVRRVWVLCVYRRNEYRACVHLRTRHLLVIVRARRTTTHRCLAAARAADRAVGELISVAANWLNSLYF